MPKVRLQDLEEYKEKSNFKKIKPTKKKTEKDYFEEVEKNKS